jgi:hypothetical protein
MSYRDIVTVCSKKCTESVNGLCGRNANMFMVNAYGTNIYHHALTLYRPSESTRFPMQFCLISER